MKGHCTCFCVKAAESPHHLHSLRFLSQDWSDCQNDMFVEVGKKGIEKYDFMEFTSR